MASLVRALAGAAVAFPGANALGSGLGVALGGGVGVGATAAGAAQADMIKQSSRYGAIRIVRLHA
jgi:hypothetical protein